MAVEEKFQEHLVNAMRQLAFLRSDLGKIRKLGLGEQYQGAFRSFDDELSTFALVLEHMGSNPAPLYFLNRAATLPSLLRPTEDGPIPESLRIIMSEEESD